MPAIPCPNPGVICAPGMDGELFPGNFSSEAPDEILFTYRRYQTFQPPLGQTWSINTCTGVCSASTYDAAYICALNAANQCQSESTPEQVPNPSYIPPSEGGSPDPAVNPPTIPKPRTLYWNEEQECEYSCDGSFFSYVVAANTFSGFSVAQANATAYEFSCAKAASIRLCLSALSVESGCVGSLLVTTFIISGLYPPFVTSITSGTLPPGMAMVALNPSTYQIYGIPTVAGTYPITISATDAQGNSNYRQLNLGIVSIANSSALPAATNGTAYSTILATSGPATAPITWAITAGALPTGLTLDSATGEISGTPTISGSYSFTVSMTF
jgi:hypothetical protein